MKYIQKHRLDTNATSWNNAVLNIVPLHNQLHNDREKNEAVEP